MAANTDIVIQAFQAEIRKQKQVLVKRFECPICRDFINVAWSIYPSLDGNVVTAALICSNCLVSVECDGVQVSDDVKQALEQK